jgi:type IX secretion system PorP/SprF family membrane protein
MIKKLTIAFAALALCGKVSAQQDPQYSAYMFNHLAVNPAYAGSRDVLSTSLLIRNQWTGIDGAPQTSSINVHGPLKKKKVGLALQIISDQLGPKKTSGLLGTYAYRLPVGKGKLAMGLRMGFLTYGYDWNAVTYKDQADQRTGYETVSLPTADAGLYYHTESFYAGVSASQIMHGKITGEDSVKGYSYEMKSHLFATAGKAFQLSDNFIFNPSIMVKAVKGAPVAVDLNVNGLIDNLVWIGVSLRKGYGFALLTQYNITSKFKIGYAFDMGMNKIGIQGRGSHELMLQYDFNVYRSRTLSPRYM